MKISSVLKTVLVSSAILCSASSFAGDDVESIVKEGNFFGEARYRYEYVDQDGIVNTARASTIRNNIGFKTGTYMDFRALFEFQLVQHLNKETFNDTVNGKTSYPIVLDPEVTEINQAWLAWSGLPQTTVQYGRQGINLDNQRFVGTVGWRQNDQIFDSVLLTNSSLPGLDLVYGYVWNVNRINGEDHPLGDLGTDTHVVHAAYKAADWLTVTGYGYWLDINRAPTLSSKTYGARLTGEVPINDSWTFFYEAEAAKQSDHGNNTSNYDDEYYLLFPGVKGHGWTLQAGYEELGGNGANSFQTPLATLHAFNGWADKFLTTPATGLEDTYGKVSYKVSGVSEGLNDTTLTAMYHNFDGDSSGNYGSEWDLSAGKSFKIPEFKAVKDLNVLLKYADYDSEDAAYTDTQKAWIQVGVKF